MRITNFSFEIPQGWALVEQVWTDIPGEEPLHSIVLWKDFFEIILHYKTVFEEVHFGPRGMPYGELVKLNERPILGNQTDGYAIIADDRTKIITYDIRSEDLRVHSLLWMLEGLDLDYT